MRNEPLIRDVPLRAVTSGPKFHFFGYYDKFPWDATRRFLLAMEVDFINRSPGPDDLARIGLIDTADGNRLTVLAGAWFTAKA